MKFSSMKFSKIWMISCLVLEMHAHAAPASTTTSPFAPFQLQLLCQQNTVQGNSCSAGLSTCNALTTKMTQLLRTQVQTKTQYLYQGKDIDLSQSQIALPGQSPSLNHIVSQPFQTPVCNLSHGEINQQTPQNGGQSCGQYGVFQIQNKALALNTISPNGSREIAYSQGGFIQAFQCFSQQVINEITTKNALTVNFCQAMAVPVANLISTALTLQQNVCGNSETVDTSYCTQHNSFSQSTNAIQNSQHQEAVCYLLDAVHQLETALMNVAYCEITQRTLNAIQNNSPPIPSSNLQTFWNVENQVVSYCVNAATHDPSCDRTAIIPLPPFYYSYKSPSCMVSQANACYQNDPSHSLPVMLTQFFQTVYPSNGSCLSSPPSFLAPSSSSPSSSPSPLGGG